MREIPWRSVVQTAAATVPFLAAFSNKLDSLLALISEQLLLLRMDELIDAFGFSLEFRLDGDLTLFCVRLSGWGQLNANLKARPFEVRLNTELAGWKWSHCVRKGHRIRDLPRLFGDNREYVSLAGDDALAELNLLLEERADHLNKTILFVLTLRNIAGNMF